MEANRLCQQISKVNIIFKCEPEENIEEYGDILTTYTSKEHIPADKNDILVKAEPLDLNDVEASSTNVTEVLSTEDELLELCELYENKVESSQKHTIRRFQCDVCNDNFNEKLYLEIHLRSHNDDSSFNCEYCDKTFQELSHLYQHIGVHRKDDRFACTVCPKVFGTKAGLSIHKRLHTGDKPFICIICNESFHRESALTSHKNKKHDKKDFECNHCSRRFSTRWNLKRHNQIHNVDDSV